MKPALIDTDIFSGFMRGNLVIIENARKYLAEYPTLNISIITYYEVLNGLLYKDAQQQLNKFFEFVQANAIISLSIDAAAEAARTYAYLRQKGTPIGHTDSLIAGIALANDMQLITNNTEHFKRVQTLELANWLH